MGSAYSKNDAPHTTEQTGNEAGQNINEYSDVGLDQAVDAQNDKAAQLPGAERADGEINWLGSSFSGVDIKVVAHLYAQIDVDKEEQDLQAELNYQVRLHQAASQVMGVAPGNYFNLVGTGATDRFLAMAGINYGDELDSRVAATLGVAFAGVPRTGGPTAFLDALTRKLQNIIFAAELTKENLTSKLQTRQEIRKKSSTTVTLATLQTLSMQTHREKYAVRALGNSYAKGYTRGPRTIAGSMIFTVFNEHALAKLIRAMSGKGSIYGERDNELSSLIADQLPPIDLTIVMANEYGQLAQMGIYGVEFVNDGMTMSVEDILTEEVCQFVARDCDVLTSKGNIRLSRLQRGMHFNDDGSQDTTGTSLLFSSREDYQKFIDKLKVRRRLLNR
jgi:hypothetical protein